MNTTPNADDPLLADLTDAQRAAVTHVDGPLLVIAAAGSGKTRVITRRVVYMTRRGIKPASILAITFTNKAAGEMKQRVSASSPRPLYDFGKLDQPWPMVCTFHSLCLRILKHYATPLGLAANFSIYDSADQVRVIKSAIGACDLSTDNFKPASVHSIISNAKNQLIGPEEYTRSAKDFAQRNMARIYAKYQKTLEEQNALDFDDLLVKTVHGLRDHPNILAELQDRFRYILIDEYQDTNRAQYLIAHALAGKHHNICVVGDPDQSIYAWRGADIRNILDFEHDYPDATVVPLEQNYRSTKTILAIADALISRNLERKPKKLWTENAQGEKALVVQAGDEHEEAAAVAERFRELNEKLKLPWNQMAVFYRMNSLSRVMEDALRRAGMPYQIARGVEFYGRKEIKDVLAYLRVLVNPADAISLERIINTPARGISDKTFMTIQNFADGAMITPWAALGRIGEVAGLTARATNAVREFVKLIELLREGVAKISNPEFDFADSQLRFDDTAAKPEVPRGRVQTIMEGVIAKIGLRALYKKEEHEGESQLANVDELVSSAREFDAENPEGTLEDYLAGISLVSDTDRLNEGEGAITLMTLHAAKGLEFDAVAIIGLEEGCLPHSRVAESANELEEERRLFFVGITRTRKELMLSGANTRMLRGKYEHTRPSRFLAELPLEHLRGANQFGSGDDLRSLQRDAIAAASQRLAASFSPGQRVRHPSYGLGRITDVSDMGSQTRVVVNFDQWGRKILIVPPGRLESVR